MNAQTAPGSRCGLDTVDIARIERLIEDKTPEELVRLFSAQELADGGAGPGRAASLAARFAAKEACCKLFPRETALGVIAAADAKVRTRFLDIVPSFRQSECDLRVRRH